MTAEHDELAPLTATEREHALRDRGVDAHDAAMLAMLTTGGVPASVLLTDAMDARSLDAATLAERLASELGVERPGAAARIKRFLNNVRETRAQQAARLAPRAVDALADVLGASREAFRRSFEAAAASAQMTAPTGALAREGRADVVIDDARAAEDADEIDALFNRPVGSV